MSPTAHADEKILDRPEVSNAIFHPRSEWDRPADPAKDHLIPVAPDTAVGGRFYTISPQGPNILFFHGNGEIVSDYDDIGPLFNRIGVNLLAVDYRGYGRSDGNPTVSTMLADSHPILEYTRNWLAGRGYNGPLIVMGRSLGSAPALELAASHTDAVAGLIIESGFAFAAPLLHLLGVDVERIGFKEHQGFRNIDKIAQYAGPTLIIHAQHDHIIPYADGKALYEASAGARKRLLRIDGADHNDLFFVGMTQYLQTIADFLQEVAGASR